MSHPQFTPSETEVDYVAIPLRRRDGSIRAWTVVDFDDFESVSKYRWCLSRGYAVRNSPRTDENGRRPLILLHREILGLPRKAEVEKGDHENRNRLDNRKNNLRVVNSAGNAQNKGKPSNTSSNHRGVSWHRGAKKWRAHVCPSGKFVHVGYFDNEEDAAQAAREARRRLMPYALD
jgi:hypothetical protein